MGRKAGKHLEFLNPREKEIFRTMWRSVSIHHTALQAILEPVMAKRTFEKYLKGMIERNIVAFSWEGKKKTYFLRENYPLHEYKKNIEDYLSSADNYLEELGTQYPQCTIDKKLGEMSYIVKRIMNNYCGLDLDRRFRPRHLLDYREIAKRTNLHFDKIVEIISSDPQSSNTVSSVLLFDLVDLRPLASSAARNAQIS